MYIFAYSPHSSNWPLNDSILQPSPSLQMPNFMIIQFIASPDETGDCSLNTGCEHNLCFVYNAGHVTD